MNTSTSFLAAHQPLSIAASTTASTAPASTKGRKADIRPLITIREQEILHLIAYEHSTKEVAAKLCISPETVNTHRKNIMIKLGVKNTAGMVRVACEKKYFNTL